MISKQTVAAKAVEWDFTTSGEKKTENVVVTLEIQDGPDKGQKITWRGYLTEGTWERTVQSLRYMGWTGDDLANISALPTAVDIVIDHETYNGKTRAKVQWVNKQGGTGIKSNLDTTSKTALAAKWKSRVKAIKAEGGGGNEGLPF